MRLVTNVKKDEKVKLDIKDKKILSLLSQNARMPVTQIAKKVNLSGDAIGYRIKGYSDKGLIQGFRSVIDIRKMEFDNYHIFLKMNNLQKDEESKLLEKLKSFCFIRAIIKYSGKYDLEIAVCARSVTEFEKNLEKILFCCEKHILDYEILVITKNYNSVAFPKSFLDIDVKEGIISEKYELDEKDKMILKIISNNARIKLYKIAEKVKLSGDAVNYRLKKMLHSGYISYFVPAINYELIGYGMYAVLMSFRSLGKKEDSTLKEFFRSDMNTLWAVKSIGRFNVLFYICASNVNAVHETISNLKNYFPENIKDYEILIAYEEYKYGYFPESLID
jgi:Lrp/AsnC family transcriptional regulator for asnA, asnC and gidA